MDAAPDVISTVPALVERLGGDDVAAGVLEMKKGTLVVWKSRNKLPAKSFLAHTTILARHGIAVDPRIWGQRAAA